MALLDAYPFTVELYGICYMGYAYLPDVLNFYHYLCLSLPSVVFLTIKLILFYVSVASENFFWFLFAWNIFFHSFPFESVCPASEVSLLYAAYRWLFFF